MTSVFAMLLICVHDLLVAVAYEGCNFSKMRNVRMLEVNMLNSVECSEQRWVEVFSKVCE